MLTDEPNEEDRYEINEAQTMKPKVLIVANE